MSGQKRSWVVKAIMWHLVHANKKTQRVSVLELYFRIFTCVYSRTIKINESGCGFNFAHKIADKYKRDIYIKLGIQLTKECT